MQYCLIYEDTFGYCRIIMPKGEFWKDVQDKEKAIQYLHSISIPDCVDFIGCLPNAIPQDLTFRDAWKKGDCHEPIKVDFCKALQIHSQRIQEVADRKIEQLNKELEIALENENTPLAVAIRRTKKILRTFGNINLSHCKTIDDIKYTIPKELHDIWTLYNPVRSHDLCNSSTSTTC